MAPDRGGKADPDKAARVRALLSNYYGETDGVELDSLASMQPGPRPAQRGADPVANAALTDLDSAEFSVERYLGSLLRDAHLDRLLSSSTAMSSDIKSLDADMQRLVRPGAPAQREWCSMLLFKCWTR
jgi:Vps51/Vps67